MTTIYVRDVAEDVAATLRERAASQGQSLSAYVASELTKVAARPSNEDVVARLRALNRAAGPSTSDIVDAVESGRR